MPLYRQLRPLGLDEADERFANAERRVGRALYRTACPACSECKGIRVVVDDFKRTKSQKRVWKRWEKLGDRLEITVAPATWSEEKIALYNRHKLRRGLAQSDEAPMDPHGYVGWLVRSCFQTVEMRYELDGQLIAVSILDLGREGISSVYMYFEPSEEVSRLSPGVYSVLREVELCRRTGRKYLYLGLYVAECDQLNYKANYFPHERLSRGRWRRFDPDSA